MEFHQRWAGVWPVIQVPWTDSDQICGRVLKKEIQFLIESRVQGVVVGMVSEITRFSEEERGEFLSQIVSLLEGRLPVIMSVGGESGKQACLRAEVAQKNGAAALMAIPPLSFRCEDRFLQKYYQEVLDSTSLPLILQDASGYLGHSISWNVLKSLYETYPERILFKPEAPPVGRTLTGLKELTGGKTVLYEGTGGKNFIEAFRRGARGTIPGSDIPWALVGLWETLQQGDEVKAWEIQALISLLMTPLQSLDSYLSLEKFLLCKQGIFENEKIRSPGFYEMDETSRRMAWEVVQRLAVLCGRKI